MSGLINVVEVIAHLKKNISDTRYNRSNGALLSRLVYLCQVACLKIFKHRLFHESFMKLSDKSFAFPNIPNDYSKMIKAKSTTDAFVVNLVNGVIKCYEQDDPCFLYGFPFQNVSESGVVSVDLLINFAETFDAAELENIMGLTKDKQLREAHRETFLGEYTSDEQHKEDIVALFGVAST